VVRKEHVKDVPRKKERGRKFLVRSFGGGTKRFNSEGTRRTEARKRGCTINTGEEDPSFRLLAERKKCFENKLSGSPRYKKS